MQKCACWVFKTRCKLWCKSWYYMNWLHFTFTFRTEYVVVLQELYKLIHHDAENIYIYLYVFLSFFLNCEVSIVSSWSYSESLEFLEEATRNYASLVIISETLLTSLVSIAVTEERDHESEAVILYLVNRTRIII